jgi:hypothetical protein
MVSVILAAILLGVSIYEHARDKNVVAYIFVVIAALVFCVGAFIAWSEENKKYLAEKAKHDAPNFQLNIESILTSYNPQLNLTNACFAAGLVNRGAASHAQGWHIRYQSHQMDISVGFITPPQERMELAAIGNRSLVLKRQDLLPARTLETIERGHLRHGRILFELPGDRRQEIYSGNAIMWIGCYDNANRLCQALFKSTPQIEGLKVFADEEIVEKSIETPEK